MKKQLRKIRDIKNTRIRRWNLKGEKVDMLKENVKGSHMAFKRMRIIYYGIIWTSVSKE